MYVNECETNGGAIMSELALKMKRLLLVGTIILSMLCTESLMNDHTAEAKVKKVERKPKNVIIMVMDGTSSTATTLARLYKGNHLH